jgi:hypothetical protein
MSDLFLRRILPVPPPESELFETHQTAHHFYREVRQRQAFEQHCQWYQQISAQHRRELEQMRGDVNIFGWFCRNRRTV